MERQQNKAKRKSNKKTTKYKKKRRSKQELNYTKTKNTAEALGKHTPAGKHTHAHAN